MRFLYILLLFSLGSHLGCHTSVHEPNLPLVDIKNYYVEGPLGHQFKVSSPEVESYILQYGSKGWIAGLKDNRKLSELYAPPKHAQIQIGREQNEEFSVSDIFLWYYIKKYPHMGDFHFSSKSERAIARHAAIREIQRELKVARYK